MYTGMKQHVDFSFFLVLLLNQTIEDLSIFSGLSTVSLIF